MPFNRSLRIWSIATAVATAGLLALGALVTSFRVGMADPVWPTAPWQLAFIDWTEPSRGFLIEHSHRLAGFTVGGLMSVLAIWVWSTEPKRGLKWAGVGAILAWLGAFGALHGVLIKQTKELGPGVPLQLPPMILGALVVAGGALVLVTAANAAVGSTGWRIRLLAMALLLGVCVQGLLGGLRVYLNALYAEQYSIVHASFSQVIFGLAIAIAVMLSSSPDRRMTWLGLATVALLFAQIVFGAILRHTLAPIGPRMHVLLALIAGYCVIALARQSWTTSKIWSTVAMSLVVVQVALGAEAWFARFAGGFETSLMRRVTEGDAWLRTSHALVGYLLFGTTIVMALRGRAVVSRKLRSAVVGGRGMKTAAPVIAASAVSLAPARFADYAALFRLRMAVMVLLTVGIGAVLASVGAVPVDRLIHVVIGTAMVTCAASALNQWIERDVDARMRRTADRPLPAGRLSPTEVFGLGGALAALGLLYQSVTLPPAACAVTAFTLFSYLAIYTPSKRITPLNTLIGAVPGALPPVIGWTAVRGEFDAGAIVLFLIVFFWQVPHFLAIAWMYRDEYGRAGHKMLTVNDATGEFTARQMLLYLVALVPVTLLAVPVLHAGAGFVAGALLLALYWLRPVLAFGRNRDRNTAKRVLRASIVYLPGLLALLLVARYVPNF